MQTNDAIGRSLRPATIADVGSAYDSGVSRSVRGGGANTSGSPVDDRRMGRPRHTSEAAPWRATVALVVLTDAAVVGVLLSLDLPTGVVVELATGMIVASVLVLSRKRKESREQVHLAAGRQI